MQICEPHKDKVRIHHAVMDMESSLFYVEGGDIRDLIAPKALQDTVVNTLLHNHLAFSNSDAVYISTMIMQAFSLSIDNMLQNEVIRPVVTDILSQLLHKRFTVITFNESNHYIGVIMEKLEDSDRYKFVFLDSLQGPHEDYLLLVQRFFTWAYHVMDFNPPNLEWEIDNTTMKTMMRQCPYSYPGQNPDLAAHIDCGLYVILMTLIYLTNNSISILTPANVHSVRPWMALHLLMKNNIIPLQEWISIRHIEHFDDVNKDSDHLIHEATNIFDRSEPDENEEYKVEEEKPLNVRQSIPRKVKIPSHPETIVPMPAGRVAEHIPIDDPAQGQTYAALSTLSNVAEGIDAGLGLYARRLYSDMSPLDDATLVGFYYGVKSLNVEDVMKYMYDPNPDVQTSYMIIFGQLAADGWNHLTNSHTCMTALINDPCETGRYNTEWTKERTKRKSDGKEVGPLRIAVRTTKEVPPHGEFFIEYGHTSFCSARLPLKVLFKAAHHYWDHIMADKSKIWWNLPQARVLFNSPYHTCAPTDQRQIIERIIRHFDRCKEDNCRCNLDRFLTSLNQPLRNIHKANKHNPRGVHGLGQMKRIQQMTEAITLSSAMLTNKSNTPNLTNATYDKNLQVLPDTSLPNAGLGLQFVNAVPSGTIIGIYENATGGKRMTSAWILSESNRSEYAVQHEGLYRDAYDTATRKPCCKVAYANDALDVTKDNLELYTHHLFPDRLVVRTTKPIPAHAWGYMPYGGLFWCDDRHPIDILIQAIRRYEIDIHTSTQDTNGDWRKLTAYRTLCTYFPNTATQYLQFPVDTASWERLNRLCATSVDMVHRTDDSRSGPDQDRIDTHSLRLLRTGMLNDTTIRQYLLRLSQHAQRRCTVIDPLFTGIIFGSTRANVGQCIHRSVCRLDLFGCELLLCPHIANGHISLITCDYASNTIIHDDSIPGYHNGQVLKDILQSFLQEHYQWRIRYIHPELTCSCPTEWIFQQAQSPKQEDGISCGVYTLLNATCRVLNLPNNAFSKKHIPRARVHIANCILYYRCYPIFMSNEGDPEDLEKADSIYQQLISRDRGSNVEKIKPVTKANKRANVTNYEDLTTEFSLREPEILKVTKCSKHEVIVLTEDSDDTTSTTDLYPFKEQSQQFKEIPTRYVSEPTDMITYNVGWHENERAEHIKLKKHRRLMDAMEDFETLANKDERLHKQREERLIKKQNFLDQWKAKAEAAMARRRGSSAVKSMSEGGKRKRKFEEETQQQQTMTRYVTRSSLDSGAVEDIAATRIDSLACVHAMSVMQSDDVSDMNRVLPLPCASSNSPELNPIRQTKRAKQEHSSHVDVELLVGGGGHDRKDDNPIESENPHSVPLSSSLEHDKGIVFI